jgi:hypothetical protein
MIGAVAIIQKDSQERMRMHSIPEKKINVLWIQT